MIRRTFAGLWASALVLTATAAFAAPDILIADFEGPDYGDWKAGKSVV